jgi:hypothetical protein
MLAIAMKNANWRLPELEAHCSQLGVRQGLDGISWVVAEWAYETCTGISTREIAQVARAERAQDIELPSIASSRCGFGDPERPATSPAPSGPRT